MGCLRSRRAPNSLCVCRYVSLDPLSPAPVDADGEVKTTGGLVDELLDAEDALFKSPKTMSRGELLEQLLSSRGGSLNRHAAEVTHCFLFCFYVFGCLLF